MKNIFDGRQIERACGNFKFGDIGYPNGVWPAYGKLLVQKVRGFGQIVIGVGEADAKGLLADAVKLMLLLELISPISAARVALLADISL